MAYIESIFQKEFQNNNYLTLNLVFAFFPISFIIGSFVVNLNLLFFCCLGIYYLKSKLTAPSFPKFAVTLSPLEIGIAFVQVPVLI